jgi:cell division protein FtsW
MSSPTETTERPVTRFGDTQTAILLSVLGLLVLGTIIISSTGITLVTPEDGDAFRQVRKHILFVVGSCLLLLVFSLIDYRVWLRRRVLFALGGIALVLLLVVLACPKVNGARRWIRIGAFSFQPSEFAKIVGVLFMAWFLTRLQPQIRSFRYGFLPAIGVAFGLAGLVLLERDVGTPVLIVAVLSMMMLAAGVRLLHFLILIPLPVIALALLVGLVRFRLDRLKAFLNPWEDPLGTGYQVIQSMVAFSSGGLFGTGLGRGFQKHGFLPAHFTDFVFALVAEEMGLLGTTLVIALFGVFLLGGIRAVRRSPEFTAGLLAFGIVSMVCLQALVNIGVVTSMLPTKGLALPFVSVGGSSMLFTAAGVGILLNIAGQGVEETDAPQEGQEPLPRTEQEEGCQL